MVDDRQRFNAHASLYAMARPHYPPELFQFLAGVTPIHDLAWDCATGNGQAAQGLSNYFRRVEATDISSAQVQSAIALPAHIHFSVQPAERTSFPDHSFDLICVAQALHWFDFDCFWPEVKRVIKPGGVFAAIAYGWSSVNPEIDAIVETHLKAVIAPYWSDRNQHCLNGYQDLAFPFEPIPCPAFELAIAWTAEQYWHYLLSWSATQVALQQLGDSCIAQAEKNLKQVWSTTPKTVRFPLTLICGVL